MKITVTDLSAVFQRYRCLVFASSGPGYTSCCSILSNNRPHIDVR